MQVFVFIFALVFMALILGYGVKTLISLKDVSEDVGLGDFVIRLREKVNTMFNFDVGSGDVVGLYLPDTVERVCFYDSEKEINLDPIGGELKNYMETNPGKNLFLMPLEFAETIFLVEHLKPGEEDNPLCFLVDGRLEME